MPTDGEIIISKFNNTVPKSTSPAAFPLIKTTNNSLDNQNQKQGSAKTQASLKNDQRRTNQDGDEVTTGDGDEVFVGPGDGVRIGGRGHQDGSLEPRRHFSPPQFGNALRGFRLLLAGNSSMVLNWE